MCKTDTFERLESNVRSYSRSFTAVFNVAKMSKVYSEDGREYIDFFAGAGALNYGHNNNYIKTQIIEYIQNDGITHALDMSTKAKAGFFEAFEEKVLEPGGYKYKLMSCGPTGANAIEAALKLSRKIKGRPGIFAFTGAFHGMSLGAVSVTSGKSFRQRAGVTLDDVTFVPHPMDFSSGDSTGYIDHMINDEYSGVLKPAAIILETVQAESGVRLMTPEFLRSISDLCIKNDVLLIVDDIQVGCGRTGPFFSFEQAGIKPDMVTMAKSISGYGLPMSLLLIKPDLDVFSPGEHNGTFRGNQLAFVGAKAALELRETLDLKTRTADNEAYIVEYINSKLLPLHSGLAHRGSGMIHGIDFDGAGGSAMCAKIAKECFERGLIIERSGRGDCVLKLMPALTIERNELTRGLEIIETAMKVYITN